MILLSLAAFLGIAAWSFSIVAFFIAGINWGSRLSTTHPGYALLVISLAIAISLADALGLTIMLVHTFGVH